MMNKYLIAPSLLSADFARLGEAAQMVLNAGADMLHLDVMDNHYVPNLTVGPLVCEALRKYGITAPIDVHLMAKPVDRLISEFAEAGASHITFHPEASDHVDRSLALIRHKGCRAGLAFNPATSLEWLDYTLDKLDMILLMSVNPGFAGQHFIPSILQKIKKAKEKIVMHGFAETIQIAVDGGINSKNITDVARAGATLFVMGSAIFNAPNSAHMIQTIREHLMQVSVE